MPMRSAPASAKLLPKDMKLLKTEALYELTDQDVPEFSFTSVLYTDGTNMFIANVSRRIYKRERETLDLHSLNGHLIKKAHVYPRYDAENFTRFTGSLQKDVFLKEPNLLMYMCDENEDTNMWKTLHQEASTCEQLQKFPHPQIARYLGCFVDDGFVVGLCFRRYTESLRQRVERCRRDFDKAFCLEAVRKGVRHLHALGFCHNDISPDNIMLDAHNVPVIIDFDSCQPRGLPLGPKGGTPGFSKADATISEPENDNYALEKLGEYLDEYA